MLIVGWMVSPGCRVDGTLRPVARSSGSAVLMTWTGIGWLTSFDRSDSRTALVELTIRWT